MLTLNAIIKFFCLLAPIFVIPLFLSICKNKTINEGRLFATKISIFSFLILTLLLFAWSFFPISVAIFQIFKFSLGFLLFLSGLNICGFLNLKCFQQNSDLSLIPLTVPMLVGPGTINGIYSFSKLSKTLFQFFQISFGILIAVLLVFLILLLVNRFKVYVHHFITDIFLKLSGLYLIVMAIQSIVHEFLIF